jgi:hypothetical protein
MARWLGQLELFPLEKRKPAAYQLQLPLKGGYWWGLSERPEVEKPAEIKSDLSERWATQLFKYSKRKYADDLLNAASQFMV